MTPLYVNQITMMTNEAVTLQCFHVLGPQNATPVVAIVMTFENFRAMHIAMDKLISEHDKQLNSNKSMN